VTGFPLQLLVVLALADLSNRFVELPFRGKRKLIDDHAPVSWQDESLWDGIHLTPGGAGIYARLVSRMVRSALARQR